VDAAVAVAGAAAVQRDEEADVVAVRRAFGRNQDLHNDLGLAPHALVAVLDDRQWNHLLNSDVIRGAHGSRAEVPHAVVPDLLGKARLGSPEQAKDRGNGDGASNCGSRLHQAVSHGFGRNGDSHWYRLGPVFGRFEIPRFGRLRSSRRAAVGGGASGCDR
jgi:hypothetical protein